MLSGSPFRSVLALCLAGLVSSACTTMSGPDDLFGSVAPSLATPRTTGTLPPPPGLSANPAAAPLTPGQIAAPGQSGTRSQNGAVGQSVAQGRSGAISDVSLGAPEDHLPPAPPMQVQPLGDLPRRADGVMILPPGPKLDVIDIGAVREGLADAPARTSPPTGVPPRAAPPAPTGVQTAPATTQPQGGFL